MMEPASNIDRLTYAARAWHSKRKVKQQDLSVTWDDSSRKEYLTGFHKRNVQRRKERVEHAKQMARKERNSHRAEKRQRLAELALSFSVPRPASDNTQAEEKEPAALVEFRSEDLVTAVTVSELSLGTPVPMVLPRLTEPSISDDAEEDQLQPTAPSRKRKPAFKYETKKERKQTRSIQLKKSAPAAHPSAARSSHKSKKKSR